MPSKVLILATALVVGLPIAAAAKECRNNYVHGSNAALLTGRYVDVAKDNAVLSWAARVTTSVGPSYADWDKARNKSFSCVRQGGRHKCTARAQPCAG